MEKILGLDLGTNSIGWAIRSTDPDLENQIIDKGVLTFEKGVGEIKGIETPLVKARTDARSKRRNYQAEKYRKWALLETLIQQGMCPLTIEELNQWRHYTKGSGRRYPQSETFINWLRFDFNGDGRPDFEAAGYDKHENNYLFRMLAVSEAAEHKKLFADNPALLGRVLYHLVQRRGFRGRDEEESKTIMTGSPENGTVGVDAIAPYLKEHKTLGAALYYLQKEAGGRIRKRYNLRSDYEVELAEICRVQEIEQNIQKKFWNAIVWQRPLRSQKGLVGYCTFEAPQTDSETNKYVKSGKKRCPTSHPLYEEYRTWVFINNLKISLSDDMDRAAFLQNTIYPTFYNASRDFKLSSIKKKLKNVKDAAIAANFPDDTKVVSATLLYRLQDLLGDDWKAHYGWDAAMENKPKDCPYSFEDIWHVLVTFDSREKLKEFAIQKLKLDEQKAETFSKIKLQQGYATLSLAAIKKLLPHLKEGFRNDEAVYLANIQKVVGGEPLGKDAFRTIAAGIREVMDEHDAERKSVAIVNGLISDQLNAEHQFFKGENDELDSDDVQTIQTRIAATIGSRTMEKIGKAGEMAIYQLTSQHYLEYLRKPHGERRHGAFLKGERLHDQVFVYLQEMYDVPMDAKKYLWHPSEQETYRNAPEKDGYKILGDPKPISNGFKNPMALKTLYKLKGLINYLLEKGRKGEGGIDADTRVVIEIARELNDANMRKAIERYQRDREKINNEYKKRIDEINEECGSSFDREDKTLLDKIRLWEEQNRTCLYTGKIINACDLFNGSKYDFEHTIPASMSFDNELKNLTIADKTFNNFKHKRIPSKLENYKQPATIDGKTYPAIIKTIETIFGKRNVVEKTVRGKIVTEVTWEKIEHLKALVAEWKHKASFASDKGIKDACIQRKHMLRFELDYWRKKLDSFTIEEYKAGWRNSQLRDTQIVTKYALPYMKTVFEKVDVQKGSVTAAFRNIYNAGPDAAQKSRAKHSHHAIDAAVLTLIPTAATRDKILQRYNDAKDLHQGYHEKPQGWRGFEYAMLLAMEQDILINFQPQHRMLKHTEKKVRKRGTQQYVKEHLEDGTWRYKMDEHGARIPLLATGDTIRGQLHNDSFFAAIKQPVYTEVNGKFIPQTNGKGAFIFQQNEKRKDELFFAMKPLTRLAYITKPEDLEIVIDPNLRAYLKKEVKSRMDKGRTFADAWAEPIWAFGTKEDRNGKPLMPIRNLRCKVRGGGGFVTNPATIRGITSYQSKKEYKRNIYAVNGETTVCGFYQEVVEGELIRMIEPFSILQVAQSDASSLDTVAAPNKEIKVRKTSHLIPLYATLKVDGKAIFYEEELSELKDLSAKEISPRMYRITQFEDGRISLRHHLNAMPEDELKNNLKAMGYSDKGASAFSLQNPAAKLRLSKAAFNFAIEGKHFTLSPDGQVKWMF